MRLPFSSPGHYTTSLPACCLLIVGIPLVALGQQTGTTDASPEKATLQALLTEVRQLRFALERSTSVVPRIQLAFQRFQLQQDQPTPAPNAKPWQVSSRHSGTMRFRAGLSANDESSAVDPPTEDHPSRN